MTDDDQLRQSVIDAACAMHRDRLTVANSGNISIRVDDSVLITPSGVPYERLKPADLVRLTLSGEKTGGKLKPSSEWKIHCDIYRQKREVKAIVHAHSPSATALSVLRKPVPAFHYMVGLMGGSEIPCADYATFGSQALSDHVLKALQGFSACLMSNHGMIATGGSLESAYRTALELESLCAQYSEACRLGEVCLLTEEEMQEARKAFGLYGQNNKGYSQS